MINRVVECVDCTEHYEYDVVFTMSCFLAGHHRLILEEEE